ncbi:hypothetical protein VVT58_16435 (plasmid) [Sphingobium sp. SJ10-10]|uniref:hypothetical protein n=1 Tax=unclassified Sphingobium TaxID=2611147 RepID=UPI002E1940F1|nr:hypothetical protein [Sphingobium sp. SJ10-10]
MASEIIMLAPGEALSIPRPELKAEPCSKKAETQHRHDHKRMKQHADRHDNGDWKQITGHRKD